MKRWIAMLLALALMGCGAGIAEEAVAASDKAAIEAALDLDNMDQEWTYSEESDAWTLSVVTAVTKPVIESEEGVSVCVPGAYVAGIDADGDGEADVTAESAGTYVLPLNFGRDHDKTMSLAIEVLDEQDICDITYSLNSHDSFMYVFKPNYFVCDLLSSAIFQGIPGLNLDLRKE